MTKQELNRDIKRLNSEIYRMSFKDQREYLNYIDITAKMEFNRLYMADKTFEYMNKESIVIMLKLNLRHRFVPLHTFGIDININN